MTSPDSTGGTILFGGTGFMGSYFLKRRPDMISVGRRRPATDNLHIQIDSLTDLSALRSVPFDKVIFLVGNSDHHRMSKETLAPGEPTAFDHHVHPLITTLEQLKDRGLKKFVHFSTILLYADEQPSMPVTETAPIDPFKSRYAMSKHIAEELCAFYGRWAPILNLRITPTYGPTSVPRWDFINSVILQLVREGAAEIWSSRPSRDFLFVEDAVTAVLELLETDATGTLNLGSGVMTPISRIVEILKSLTGRPIADKDIPVTGPTQFEADLTRLRRWIDWRPRYTIEEGLRRTYEEMKALEGVCV